MTAYRLKGIKRTTVRKGGKKYTYLYHRATQTRLIEQEGSAAFIAEVAKLDEMAAKSEAKPNLAALIAAYLNSHEFGRIADLTKRDYRKVLDWFAPMADTNPLSYTPAHCMAIREKAYEAHGYRFAKYVIQVGSVVWKWGRLRRRTKDNPWKEVPYPPKPKTGRPNLPWKAEELIAALNAAQPGLARGLALGAMGWSAGDIVKFKWEDFDADAARGKTGVIGRLTAPEALTPIFEGERPAETIATNAHGKPFKTANTFTKARRDLMTKLADEKLVRPGLTTHGLRHTLGKIVSEEGGDLQAVKSALQHSSVKMAQHYAAHADMTRRQKEAMSLLSRRLEFAQKDMDNSPKRRQKTNKNN